MRMRVEAGRELHGRDLVRVGDFLKVIEEARERILTADPPCEALAQRGGTSAVLCCAAAENRAHIRRSR